MTAQDFTTIQHFCDSAALLPLHSWLPALLKPHVPFRGTRGQPDGKSLSKRKRGSKRRLTTIWALKVPNSPVLAVALKAHSHSPSLRRLHFSTSLVPVPGISKHCEPVSLSPQRIPGGPVSKALRPTLSPLQPGVQQTQLPPAQLQSPHFCGFPPQLWLLRRPHSLRRRARSHAPWGSTAAGASPARPCSLGNAVHRREPRQRAR